MDNQSPWSSTSDISCIDECDPALNPQLDSPTCMKTITPDKFSNIPNVIGRKRSLIEQNTPNKKKKVTNQYNICIDLRNDLFLCCFSLLVRMWQQRTW